MLPIVIRSSSNNFDEEGFSTGLGNVFVPKNNRVFGKEDQNVTMKVLKFEVRRSKGRKRRKKTWKKQVENEMKKNGQVKEDACDRAKWRGVVKTNNHMKSDQLRRRGQYQIQNETVMGAAY